MGERHTLKQATHYTVTVSGKLHWTIRHMRLLITIVFVFSIDWVFGQGLKADSIAFKNNWDKYIDREFDSLEADSLLSTIEIKYGTKLNSLASCFTLATVGMLNKEELTHLNARVEEIAGRFYQGGSPIFLSIGRSNSADATNELNRKGNKYNVTYVSFGNYCVVTKGENEFEKVFNDRTMKLLGIEKIE